MSELWPAVDGPLGSWQLDLRLDWNLLTRRLPQLLHNHNQAVKLSVCLHLLVRAGCMVHSAGSS
jgi:hypothetical protein